MAKVTKVKQETQIDYSKYAGATGFEKVTTQDLGVPFLSIIQKGSPEVDKTHKDFSTKKIQGASVGDVFNTVSREILYTEGGDPIIFIPCFFEKMFVEWKPRDEGGGIVKSHTDPNILSRCTRGEDGRDVLPNGNNIITTAYFLGLVVHGDRDPERCIIGMSSTQLKKARGWLNMMQSIKITVNGNKQPAPMFSHRYNITTIAEQNQHGGWYGWKIEGGGQVTIESLLNEGHTIAVESSKRIPLQITTPAAAPTDVL
jgi:hypothetical protein